jgi:hypothetical protein
MCRLLAPVLAFAALALACASEATVVPDQAPPSAAVRPSSLDLPSDPPLAAPRPLLRAAPADCGASPELGARRTPPGPSTLPVATALERARQIPAGMHRAGDVARWFDKEPADATLVRLRDGRTVWLLGFNEPPPFRVGGVFVPGGRASTWTAWAALLDDRTGDFVLAMTCGRVDR